MHTYGVMAGAFTFVHPRVLFAVTVVLTVFIKFYDGDEFLQMSAERKLLPWNVAAVTNWCLTTSAPGTRPLRCPRAHYCTCVSISSALFSSADRRLLFAGRQQSIYRPSSSSSRGAVVVALLLLLGGIEPNPGPLSLRLGLINARSAVAKAALIHDAIQQHRLDVLVVVETWMHASQPPAIINDIAPPGFLAIHHFRSDGQDGGVAIVHKSELKVSALTFVTDPQAFECVGIRLSATSRRINIGAIYRPPTSSAQGVAVGSFCAEFADFLDEFLSLPGEPLLCGDFNCPGSTGAMDNQLDDVLSDRCLLQLVNQPTHHAGNILDLIITLADANLVSNIEVTDIGLSDHSLVEADLNLCRSTPATRHLKYRNIKAVDPVRFAELIRDQENFTSPPGDVNAFADMLDESVMSVLDVLAPNGTRR